MPDVTGTPYRALTKGAEGTPTDHYVTISSATNENDSYVHAFGHGDQMLDPTLPTPLKDQHVVGTILYHRSVVNHATAFTTMSTADSGQITLKDLQYAYWGVSDATGLIAENGGGINGAKLIDKGDYYYLFYTRFMMHNERQNKWLTDNNHTAELYVAPATDGPDHNHGSSWGAMCVAKALKTSVLSANYSSNNNPWKKYYNGSWNEDWDGQSTSVIDNNFGDGGSQVACVYGHVFFMDDYDRYMCIHNGNDLGQTIYLSMSDGSTEADLT